ncbi:MAG: hypothetical protein EpisKO_06040 [Epibacterium sp.]
MRKQKRATQTPHTDAFRAWLDVAIKETGTAPATVARAIGASVNSVGVFLNDPARDITLSRAATLEGYLRECARAQGKNLPAIRELMNAAGVKHA